MPWNETSAMDEKVKFVAAYLEGGQTMSALCREHGISRPTGYALIERYQSDPEGWQRERSRAPHDHPNETSKRLVKLIVQQRKKQPAWGPVTIQEVLRRRYPEETWPAVSTIGEILKREGLIAEAPKRRRQSIPRTGPLTQAEAPNDVWTIDYKGQFRTGDGRYCYPLTVLDQCSRYLLVCAGKRTVEERFARPEFLNAFEAFGLPRVIRSDNGPPFATNGLAGLSKLSVLWVRLGIRVERTRPGHPEENGGHERMHRTMKAELLRTVGANLAAQQVRCNGWKRSYNEERPHQALAMRTPSELYRGSLRRMPDRIPEVVYPKDYDVRMIRQNGSLKWGSVLVFLSESLVHQPVGLARVDEERLLVYFMGLKLGVLDEHLMKIVPLSADLM